MVNRARYSLLVYELESETGIHEFFGPWGFALCRAATLMPGTHGLILDLCILHASSTRHWTQVLELFDNRRIRYPRRFIALLQTTIRCTPEYFVPLSKAYRHSAEVQHLWACSHTKPGCCTRAQQYRRLWISAQLTNSPASMMLLASSPRGVLATTAARSMSPVARWHRQ